MQQCANAPEGKPLGLQDAKGDELEPMNFGKSPPSFRCIQQPEGSVVANGPFGNPFRCLAICRDELVLPAPSLHHLHQFSS